MRKKEREREREQEKVGDEVGTFVIITMVLTEPVIISRSIVLFLYGRKGTWKLSLSRSYLSVPHLSASSYLTLSYEYGRNSHGRAYECVQKIRAMEFL